MKRHELRGGELTPPNRFEIDYFPPEGPVAQFVTTFYHFRCDDPVVRDIQPAAVGHLSLFPYGKGRMSLPDGGYDPSHEVNLLTPFSAAAAFEVDGPFHAIGAALSPLGWAALTGMHAQEHANRLYNAGDWLPEEIETNGKRLCEEYRNGSAAGQDLVAELSRMIVSHARLPRRKHLELLSVVGQWLTDSLLPNVEDLYAASSFSRRQTQRLVQQYFGVSPVALRRKYRALRAAAMLSRPQLTPEEEARLAESFYDQPHMIHELREFVGRTPTRLADGESPYLSELIDGKNLRELD
ncbi:helix-turn-helix domain-containing protein [Aurantiacibacter sp. MUD11]|uniref:helix-turn-helix transcriptional regulator n=1 Tax=Aurantiacibacter sp. MUD11 TaxID=3003265 RepID=UPI0022AA7975|nr:helix-turn-helix domain-containing protein [Aurantiacibacter sp. MUD11]WAT17153.1 helix-turn-helix domain-containing protein [Aurantiacibacter sp. MUD11]